MSHVGDLVTMPWKFLRQVAGKLLAVAPAVHLVVFASDRLKVSRPEL
jgi:hypothetical protein